jgi:hypothetical protein
MSFSLLYGGRYLPQPFEPSERFGGNVLETAGFRCKQLFHEPVEIDGHLVLLMQPIAQVLPQGFVASALFM